MKRVALLALLSLLSACGSNDSGQGAVVAPIRPTKGDLSDLNGLPMEEFIRAIAPRLAKEPGIQNPAELAAALDQKWKINCEQICRIERK